MRPVERTSSTNESSRAHGNNSLVFNYKIMFITGAYKISCITIMKASLNYAQKALHLLPMYNLFLTIKRKFKYIWRISREHKLFRFIWFISEVMCRIWDFILDNILICDLAFRLLPRIVNLLMNLFFSLWYKFYSMSILKWYFRTTIIW